MSRLLGEMAKKTAKRNKKRAEYHHGDLKNALVEAAARLVVERGIAALSLREVAREAGVSHAAPYHHFIDKSALLAAVAEEGFKRFDSYQARALRGAPTDPRERLKALGRAYVRFAIANPHFFRIMFREDVIGGNRPASLAEVANRTFDRLVNTVRECQKLSGNKSENPIPSAIRAWALVHGLASLWLDGPLHRIPDAKKIVDTIIHQVSIFLPDLI